MIQNGHERHEDERYDGKCGNEYEKHEDENEGHADEDERNEVSLRLRRNGNQLLHGLRRKV